MHKYIWTPDIEAELAEQERDIVSKKDVENVGTEDGVRGQVGTEDKRDATSGEKKGEEEDGTITDQHALTIYRPTMFNKRKPLPSAKTGDALPNIFDEYSSDDEDTQHDVYLAKKRKTVAPSAHSGRDDAANAGAEATEEGVRSESLVRRPDGNYTEQGIDAASTEFDADYDEDYEVNQTRRGRRVTARRSTRSTTTRRQTPDSTPSQIIATEPLSLISATAAPVVPVMSSDLYRVPTQEELLLGGLFGMDDGQGMDEGMQQGGQFLDGGDRTSEERSGPLTLDDGGGE